MLALVLLVVAAAPPVHLLRPGLFHKGEISASSDSGWLGLVREGPERFAWRRCAVAIEPVMDPLVDQDTERTGSEVKVDGVAPLILAQGLDRLQGIPVTTVMAVPAGKPLGNGETLEFRLLTGQYRLEVQGARLLLKGPAAEQTLQDRSACALVWAGDLDGDGRLDLLLKKHEPRGVSELTLWLSSTAAGGKLVEPVARLRTTEW